MATLSKKRGDGDPRPSFREILICSKKELAPYGTVFVLSAENYEQEKLGTLFGIFKILDLSPDSSYIVNLLTSVIKKEYFSRSERPAEESFEASLRKANLALAELARHGSISWAGKISFAGGVIERSNLHFANLGDTSVFLFRSGQVSQISQSLTGGKTAEPHPLKTFTDISSGKIEKNDKIIFTTSDLLDIFSPGELRHNASRFSREEFSGLIEASLHGNTELGGVIIIDFPIQTETNNLLDPNHLQKDHLQKIAALPSLSEPREINQPLSSAPERQAPILSEIRMPPPQKRKPDLFIKEEEAESQQISFASKIFSSLKKIYIISLSQFVSLFRNLSGFARRLKVKEKMFFLFRGKMKPGHLVEKITGHSRCLAGHLSGIDSKKKKFYAGIFSAAILVSIVSIILYNNHKSKPVSQPVSDPSPQAEDASQPSVLDDIQVKPVSTLEPVIDLAQKSQTLFLLNGSLFSLVENSKTILKINSESKTVEENPCTLNVGNFKLMAPMPNLNALFILTEDNKIVSFTPINKNFQENSIMFPADLSALDIKAYLTYLYFLDPSANQIYRYPRAEGGFGDRQDWLKSGADIKNATEFAINDDLFAASANGFQAYAQGKKDDGFNIKFPTIPITIDRIYTEPGFNGIYILDNKNHRVIEYDKQGNITTQYFNDSIAGVKDFVVDETSKSIFLLQDKKILKFSLE
jgi:hypothetical protein